MAESLDVEAMLQRFRDRAHAVRNRPLPPVAGEERTRFIEQAQVDFQDFAIIGDADGVDRGRRARAPRRPAARPTTRREPAATTRSRRSTPPTPTTRTRSRSRGEVRPKEQAHAELMTEWLARLDPDATDAQHLAARAHHLRRWSAPAVGVPGGPRRLPALAHRAQEAARRRGRRRSSTAVGYDAATIERTQRIIRKEGLGSDPQVQTHEDALCLVFLETQLAELADAQGDEKMVDIIQKTAAKMSPRRARARGRPPDAGRRPRADRAAGAR